MNASEGRQRHCGLRIAEWKATAQRRDRGPGTGDQDGDRQRRATFSRPACWARVVGAAKGGNGGNLERHCGLRISDCGMVGQGPRQAAFSDVGLSPFLRRCRATGCSPTRADRSPLSLWRSSSVPWTLDVECSMLDIRCFFAAAVPRVARQPVLTAVLFPFGVHPLFLGH